MSENRNRTSSAAALSLLVLLAASAAPGLPQAKDVGPSSAACDRVEKGSAAWRACIGEVSALSDAELFYAGYWLAKQASYAEALQYLTRAKNPDERILTYIGFATRKLGNVDAAFAFYDRALALNPDYSVARAYLGDAFLAKGDLAHADEQLGEIAKRCGTACAEYAELAEHIARYRETTSPRG